MRIAIIGYGRMGKTIEALSINRGHKISKIIDINSADKLSDLSVENTDVVIEFTNPKVAFDNLSSVADRSIPIVSGTGILEVNTQKETWINDLTEDIDKLSIVSKRIDEVPGTHTIRYESEVDQISISHEAFSRQGFALGAVVAAEWIVGKQGIYSMRDVLSIEGV